MRSPPVKSAARVLDVLELLAALPQGIRVNQLARALAMPKSSASTLLGTLVERGYVDAAGEGYVLAEAFRGGGWVGGVTGVLVRASHGIMERLVADTGESAFLGVATSSLEVRYVAKAVSANPLRYDVELESLRPAHSTSIGQVLLASLPAAQLDRYFLTHPLGSAPGRPGARERAARRAIGAARENGFVVIADSHVVGTSGTAAPVSVAGRIVAGLAIIAPTARFEAARTRIVPHVVAAALALGNAIGNAADSLQRPSAGRNAPRAAQPLRA